MDQQPPEQQDRSGKRHCAVGAAATAATCVFLAATATMAAVVVARGQAFAFLAAARLQPSPQPSLLNAVPDLLHHGANVLQAVPPSLWFYARTLAGVLVPANDNATCCLQDAHALSPAPPLLITMIDTVSFSSMSLSNILQKAGTPGNTIV